MMRLGIFGGTFDPVHLGHLLLAEQCREQCRLDQVWFVPAGTPPHKTGGALAAANARAEMVELAIAGHPQFSVSRMELSRTGASFTVDTLEQIRRERPEDELFFLIGADSLVDLPQWREPLRIVELATLVIVNRGGLPAPDLEPLRPQLGNAAIDRMQIVTIPGMDIASRDIRHRVLDGHSIRYLVPRSVECYIGAHGIYRGS